MSQDRSEVRIALPSKGRLSEDSLSLLSNAGLPVYKPNPRQYKAAIPNLKNLTVLFQRVGDIVTSVRDGSIDFGITGWDIFSEKEQNNGELLVLLNELGFGYCTLNVIVPEIWSSVNSTSDLIKWQESIQRPIRVATKFPYLTEAFFKGSGVNEVSMIAAEGTLEIAPTIGYADVIVDLISSGTTLRDNRLKVLNDGLILESQACLIANRNALKTKPEVLRIAKQFLEFIVAHLRATENVSIFANIRGESPDSIANQMFSKSVIGGLQGPTISQVINQESKNWYAVHLIIQKDQLHQAIQEIREVGGSGVVVTPVTYIFEEEPLAYKAMLTALEDK
jgi:ATP phosphoribosyltransferase